MIAALLLFPFVAGAVMILIKSPKLNSAVLVLYAAAFLAAVGLHWDRPAQISPYFRIDSLNILFLLVLGAVNLGVSVYTTIFLARSSLTPRWHTYYAVCFLLFVASMTGVLLSTHLALLWVFIEATTLTSAPFITFDRSRRSLEALWKYVFICSIGIALSFVGIILLSMGAGHLDSLFFSDLCRNARSIDPFWLKTAFLFLVIGFGTKAGLAPVHAWLPDAHSEAPSPVSAMLSGTLLNAALLGIARVFKLMTLAGAGSEARTILVVMGFLSLFVSAVFMLKSVNYKRMLAYSSIENMGIAAIGISAGGIGAFAAMLHIASHSLTKASFFLTSGNIYHRHHTKDIGSVQGLLKSDAVTGWLWIACFLGIAGFPPFPSFFSELLVAQSLLKQGSAGLAALYLVLLAVIVYGMGRAVFRMSFGSGSREPEGRLHVLEYAPQIVFLLILVFSVIYPSGAVLRLIRNAASAL